MKGQFKFAVDAFDSRVVYGQSQRGAIIGNLSSTLGRAAKVIGLDFSDFRKARLKFASDLTGREINTFNDLSSAEMFAIGGLCRYQGRIEGWLKTTYGTPVELPGLGAAK